MATATQIPEQDPLGLLKLFIKPPGETTTTSVSPEGLQAIMASFMNRAGGIPGVAMGAKSAGAYNATVTQQRMNDLLTRAAGEAAARTATTTKQGEAPLDMSKLLKAAAIKQAASSLMGGKGKSDGKPVNLGKSLQNLIDALTGKKRRDEEALDNKEKSADGNFDAPVDTSAQEFLSDAAVSSMLDALVDPTYGGIPDSNVFGNPFSFDEGGSGFDADNFFFDLGYGDAGISFDAFSGLDFSGLFETGDDVGG